MKHLISILISVLCLSNIQAAKVAALFSYSTFDQPGKSPFLETYLKVAGVSVLPVKNQNGKFQGKLEVTMVFKNGENIIHFEKYNINTPEVDSANQEIPDFIDIQRIPLANGDYKVELKIDDINTPDKEVSIIEDLTILYPTTKPSVSSIEFLESYQPSDVPDNFFKNGYKLIPYANSFYPKSISKLRFYTEIYRTKELSEDILIRYYISNKDNKQLIDNLFGTSKQNAKDVNVLLAEIPIDALPSGNYNLNIEVRDRKNNLLAFQQTLFQRSNQQQRLAATSNFNDVQASNTFAGLLTNTDTLTDYIASTFPIATRLETDIAQRILQESNTEEMQKYFFYFWSKRDAEKPDVAWANYLLEVRKVNAAYSTRNRRGYETDRGRVYLQYGPPNTINKDEDAVSYPYEIWHYYQIGFQTNRRFVFTANDRSTNDFLLIHSDAQGEIQDPSWQLRINRRTAQFNDLDLQTAPDNYGSRSKENFENPR